MSTSELPPIDYSTVDRLCRDFGGEKKSHGKTETVAKEQFNAMASQYQIVIYYNDLSKFENVRVRPQKLGLGTRFLDWLLRRNPKQASQEQIQKIYNSVSKKLKDERGKEISVPDEKRNTKVETSTEKLEQLKEILEHAFGCGVAEVPQESPESEEIPESKKPLSTSPSEGLESPKEKPVALQVEQAESDQLTSPPLPPPVTRLLPPPPTFHEQIKQLLREVNGEITKQQIAQIKELLSTIKDPLFPHQIEEICSGVGSNFSTPEQMGQLLEEARLKAESSRESKESLIAELNLREILLFICEKNTIILPRVEHPDLEEITEERIPDLPEQYFKIKEILKRVSGKISDEQIQQIEALLVEVSEIVPLHQLCVFLKDLKGSLDNGQVERKWMEAMLVHSRASSQNKEQEEIDSLGKSENFWMSLKMIAMKKNAVAEEVPESSEAIEEGSEQQEIPRGDRSLSPSPPPPPPPPPPPQPLVKGTSPGRGALLEDIRRRGVEKEGEPTSSTASTPTTLSGTPDRGGPPEEVKKKTEGMFAELMSKVELKSKQKKEILSERALGEKTISELCDLLGIDLPKEMTEGELKELKPKEIISLLIDLPENAISDEQRDAIDALLKELSPKKGDVPAQPTSVGDILVQSIALRREGIKEDSGNKKLGELRNLVISIDTKNKEAEGKLKKVVSLLTTSLLPQMMSLHTSFGRSDGLKKSLSEINLEGFPSLFKKERDKLLKITPLLQDLFAKFEENCRSYKEKEAKRTKDLESLRVLIASKEIFKDKKVASLIDFDQLSKPVEGTDVTEYLLKLNNKFSEIEEALLLAQGLDEISDLTFIKQSFSGLVAATNFRKNELMGGKGDLFNRKDALKTLAAAIRSARKLITEESKHLKSEIIIPELPEKALLAQIKEYSSILSSIMELNEISRKLDEEENRLGAQAEQDGPRHKGAKGQLLNEEALKEEAEIQKINKQIKALKESLSESSSSQVKGGSMTESVSLAITQHWKGPKEPDEELDQGWGEEEDQKTKTFPFPSQPRTQISPDLSKTAPLPKSQIPPVSERKRPPPATVPHGKELSKKPPSQKAEPPTSRPQQDQVSKLEPKLPAIAKRVPDQVPQEAVEEKIEKVIEGRKKSILDDLEKGTTAAAYDIISQATEEEKAALVESVIDNYPKEKENALIALFDRLLHDKKISDMTSIIDQISGKLFVELSPSEIKKKLGPFFSDQANQSPFCKTLKKRLKIP